VFRIVIILAIAISSFGCSKKFKPLGLGLNKASKNIKKRFRQDQDQDSDREALKNPDALTDTAPDEFKVKITTTKGDIILKVTREWAPNGADRFYNMVKIGYFEDIAIFRAIEGFMFQFGVHGDPEISKHWRGANFEDDPIREDVGNEPGFITFAHTGEANSRSVQFFINLGDNRRKLDHLKFTPFGNVVEGMEVVNKINTEYGENRNREQARLQMDGNDYIREVMPNADFIESITFVTEDE
jgi:peptidyl-prolyl cis-trans isomerase A (cyclophilin A)